MGKNRNKNIWYFKAFTIGLVVVFAIYFCLLSDGVWGVNKTVGWTWDFTNIVWWVGILFSVIQVLLIVLLVYYLLKKVIDLLKK